MQKLYLQNPKDQLAILKYGAIKPGGRSTLAIGFGLFVMKLEGILPVQYHSAKLKSHMI